VWVARSTGKDLEWKRILEESQMTDPVTMTAGVIATLAFQEFVKSGAGELAKRFTGEAIAKMGQLRDLIRHKLRGNFDAEEALEKVQAGSEEEISDVTTYLKSAMKNDQDFAAQVQAIAQEINAGKLDVFGRQEIVASGDRAIAIGKTAERTTIVTGNGNNISISDTGKPKIGDTSKARIGKELSEAAVNLLTIASNDHAGAILKGSTGAGTTFLITNSKQFPPGSHSTARQEAMWIGALRDLVDLGFIRDYTGKDEYFKVTHDGFEYVSKQEYLVPVLIEKPAAVGHESHGNPTSQPISLTPIISPKLDVNMELSGNQVKQLRGALQSAFPEKSKLKQLLREEMDVNLDAVVGNGNLTDIIADLITFAESEGRLVEFLTSAIRVNPGNLKLRLFAESVGLLRSALEPTILATEGTGAAFTPPQTEQNAKTSTTSPVSLEPIEIFISYSHRDDDLRDELVIHLSNLRRQGKISAWHDRAIEAGSEWETQIKARLESAQIILLLISPPFMASDYCYDLEMQRAIQRHNEGDARVIPIILRPVDWKDTPFSKLQALPKDAKPITQWGDRDIAFVDVVQGIRRAVDSLTNE
jgi:Effector-associated domain 1/TIR domain